jgi:AraC-like DNA-binding protein
MRYITRLRMARAAGYLATTQRTLSSIARECGYDTDSSFSKAFKREFGMTPGRYRETASRRPIVQVAAS